jgi:hypothetical protein
MTKKHFKAILAKNEIARELTTACISINYIIACLEDIEKFIGEGNQPSVKNIIDHNSNPKRNFNI